MKKLIIVLVLLTVITAGTVFAADTHPDGLGIGVLWRGGMGWGGGGFGGGGAALSLKIPSLPIFWGINLGFGSGWFSIGLQGDGYFLGGPIISNLLYWYLGIGGYFGATIWNNGLAFGVGARLPIGISVQIINRLLEIFLEIAPSLGIGFGNYYSGIHFPDGGLHVGLGFRVWL